MNNKKSVDYEPKATSGQIILINKMMADQKMNPQKEAIVSEITSSRTDNVREVFVHEATEIIRFLKSGKTLKDLVAEV